MNKLQQQEQEVIILIVQYPLYLKHEFSGLIMLLGIIYTMITVIYTIERIRTNKDTYKSIVYIFGKLCR